MALAAQQDDCTNWQHELLCNTIVPGKITRLIGDQLASAQNKFTEFGMIVNDIFVTNHVTLKGIKYVCQCSFVAVETCNALVNLGQIMTIYIVNQTAVFAVKMFDTLYFDDNMQSYCLQEPDNPEGLVLVQPSQLVDHTNFFSINDYDGQLYVPIKYDMTDVIELHQKGFSNHYNTFG